MTADPTLWKITDAAGRTCEATQWGPGVTHTVAPGANPRLCTGDVLHAYRDDVLALLLNPGHANYDPPRLWRAEGEIAVADWGKVGCFSLTTVEEMPLPAWFTEETQRRRVAVTFAILCAEAVLPIFEQARPGDDRPRQAIEAARSYLRTRDAARAAGDAGAAWAAWAAGAAGAAGDDPPDFAVLARQAVAEEEATFNAWEEATFNAWGERGDIDD
jgi:hypothetical protein